jgi:L-methionine (R)-S-oxide reductase
MTKEDRYTVALREIDVRLQKGGDLIADLGNVAAVLKKRLQYFWTGFYLVKGNRLVLGPFQGTPACVFLPLGSGVCGMCAANRELVLVPDVEKFPGHIVCDGNSKSELCVPLFDGAGSVRAVLDMDSEYPNAFDEMDVKYCERISARLTGVW